MSWLDVDAPTTSSPDDLPHPLDLAQGRDTRDTVPSFLLHKTSRFITARILIIKCSAFPWLFDHLQCAQMDAQESFSLAGPTFQLL